MKYIVANTRLFEMNGIKAISLEQALEMLWAEDTLGFDTETMGLNCFQDKLLCSQFGTKKFQVLFDHSFVDIQKLKPLLESDKTFVGQNLKFDLRFLYYHGIVPKNIFDTYLAEILLTNGLQYNHRTLKDIALKYCNVELDKSVRGTIIYRGLTEEVINYALADVEDIIPIMDAQIVLLKQYDLMGAINLENAFCKVLAYIEHSGIKLDIPQWMAKFKKNKEALLLAETSLNDYLWDSEYKQYFDTQLNLFSTERMCLMNWSSPKQVLDFFNSLGINTLEWKAGVERSSVDAKILEKQKNDFPVIPIYLKYKELQKECSTYGENWLKYIEPTTGRIHTNFSQLMDTSRISSGDKYRDLPNMCNLPADPATRECFVAEVGNLLIDCDYSGQETVVLANLSQDRGMIEFFKTGFGDQHSFVASKMFEELKDLTVDEIKTKHKDKRQLAKAAGFAIAYGGNGTTIARSCNISEAQGEFVYNAYFKAFPDLPAYFKKVYQAAVAAGYIEFNDVTKHKYFIPNFEEFKLIDSETRDNDFWRNYRENKETDTALRDKVKGYFKLKGEIQRKAQNYRKLNAALSSNTYRKIGRIAGKLNKLNSWNYVESIKVKQYVLNAI
jgi:DNA polymerase-1